MKEEPKALRCWMIAGPEVARVLNEFEAGFFVLQRMQHIIMNKFLAYKDPFFGILSKTSFGFIGEV